MENQNKQQPKDTSQDQKQNHKLHYNRYRVKYDTNCPSLQDAIQKGIDLVEYGNGCPTKITCGEEVIWEASGPFGTGFSLEALAKQHNLKVNTYDS